MKSDPIIGLVLSGGGFRGVGHVALLSVLEDLGIRPSVISGVSIGAIIGALYAKGDSPAQILDTLKDTKIFRPSSISVFKPGFLDSRTNLKYFQSHFPDNDFGTLQKQLYVTTTNLQESRHEVFSKGPLIEPLMASSALPPLFSPVTINGQYHTDGCIMNSFPVEPLLDRCDIIIGSSVNETRPISRQSIRTSFGLSIRTARLRMLADAKIKYPLCDYIFAPSGMSSFNALNRRAIDRIYRFSHQHVQRDIEQIKQVFPALFPSFA